ncbi:GTPase [Tundrisphaera sp. TA3]|uniref:GTPase n=1 Tax=Tundrisphaera sp. TA3 TaxID=3435775 RepID=UPI003EBBAB3C
MTDQATLDVAVYGIINAGKSSLINALTRRGERLTGPIGGTTTGIEAVDWREIDGGHPSGHAIRLLDTPGLDEVDGQGRDDLATEAARRADLVIFVLAEDLTATARRAIADLHALGKPMLVVVNKVDLLDEQEQGEVLRAIRDGLAGLVPEEDILPTAAAPIVKRLVFAPDGSKRVETTRGEPGIEALERRLISALEESAGDLEALNTLSRRVDAHRLARESDRERLRERATAVADETGAALAIALAVNPVPLIDFLTGPGGLAILVRRVMGVYGETPTAEATRAMASELIRGGRIRLWGSLAGTIAGGALKLVPGVGHVAGAIAQGASAGYFAHVVGRALVDYLDNGHDWGDGGLIAALDRVAASTDRRALTRGLVDRIKSRIKGTP